MDGELPKGKIQTVLGPIDPSTLGVTLAHEHLYSKFDASMFEPRQCNPAHQNLTDSAFDCRNLWWINYHPYSHKDNLVMHDEITQTAVLDEMKFYKSVGGGSVVDATPFGKDLKFLQNLSRNSGVNIIAGTGYYVQQSFKPEKLNLTTEEMVKEIKQYLLFGQNGVKCGIIGEIGTTFPVFPVEKRSLQASGIVQEELNVPANIHPGRGSQAPVEILRIFLEAGGKADRTVMSHLDRTLNVDEELLEFAKMGSYLEFDLFGNELSYYELSDECQMPSDLMRINKLRLLIENGFLDKILISHDIHTKHRLMRFGGHGYSHILLNTIPEMQRRGFSSEEIDQIMVQNTARLLTL